MTSTNTLHAPIKPVKKEPDYSAILRHLDVAVTSGADLEVAGKEAVLLERGNIPEHLILHCVGNFLLEQKEWSLAEDYAIESLKSLPRYGKAFKLLGNALKGAGNLECAAHSFHHSLSDPILDKHFSDIQLRWAKMPEEPAVKNATSRISVHRSFAASTLELTPPISLSNRVFREMQGDRINSTEAKTIVLEQGSLWFDGFNIIAFDHENHIVQQREARSGHAQPVIYRVKSTPARRIAGRVSLLGNRGAHNYYHWMHDILPRLAVLRASGFDLDSIDKFILAEPRYDFQYETLEHFGISKNRLHTGYPHISSDEILLPIYGCNSLGMCQGQWAPRFLNQEFGPARSANGTKDKPQYLYVSRGSTGARGISNEAELLELLHNFDFRTIKPEEHTVREQADIFSDADVVLGPHGAGLSNIVFCKPGTKVIELFNIHIQPCFWALSNLLGHRHYIHHCNENYAVGKMSEDRYYESADARRLSPFAVQLDPLLELLKLVGVDTTAR